MDLDNALVELQRLIAVAESDETGESSGAITQRLRELEDELKVKYSVSQSKSPSPRRHSQSAVAFSCADVAAASPSSSLIRQSIARADRIGRDTNELVDITAPLSGSFHASNPDAQLSFAQHFSSDDRQRLTFVLDSVSNQLRQETKMRRQLEEEVVPPLLQRIEELELELLAEKKLTQRLRLENHRLGLGIAAASATRSDKLDACITRIHDICDRMVLTAGGARSREVSISHR